MNLILLHDADFESATLVRLTGRRARHVHDVHRAGPGDQLTVGRVGGGLGTGVVRSVAPGELVLEVTLDASPPAPSGIDLLLAMPRPKILRKVLQAIASLGVKRLVLLNSFRVEKSYFDSPLLAPEDIEGNLVLGLEQARDTTMPEVLIRKRFKPFVEDELHLLWPEATAKLLAHPVAPGGIEAVNPGRPSEPLAVAIGPEGGWIPYEVEMLEARGFRTFSLGPRILRVDVAVPFILGQLDLARRARVSPQP